MLRSTGRAASVALIVGLAALAGCTAPSTEREATSTESPYIVWQRSEKCMIRQALKPSIKVCVTGSGDLDRVKTLTTESLLKWLDAIRPLNAAITSTVELTCTAPDGYLTVDNTGEYSYAGDVHINSGSAPGTILHEFGHAFACLGDTYLGRTAGACASGQPHSIMCDGLLRYDLSSDDIDGVRAQYVAMVGTGTGGGGGPVGPTTTDTDGDGVLNTDDVCGHTPAGSHVWHDEYSGQWKGCAHGETPDSTPPSTDDADADGVSDSADRCPNTPAGSHVWHDESNGQWTGCAGGQTPTR